jgi:hypothetical protein
MFVELLRDGERTIASNANKTFNIELFDRRLHACKQLRVQFSSIGNTYSSCKAALIGRTQNGSTLIQDPSGVFGSERDVAYRIVKSFVTLQEPYAVVAKLG